MGVAKKSPSHRVFLRGLSQRRGSCQRSASSRLGLVSEPGNRGPRTLADHQISADGRSTGKGLVI